MPCRLQELPFQLSHPLYGNPKRAVGTASKSCHQLFMPRRQFSLNSSVIERFGKIMREANEDIVHQELPPQIKDLVEQLADLGD
jgi:hypothetical protein